MGKIVISTNVSLDGVVQDPDGKEGFSLGGWFGQFGGEDLEEWAKVSLEEALARRGPAAGSAQRRVVRRALVIAERRVGGQVEQPAQVRRVLDPRTSPLEQLDGPQGRRGGRGHEAEAGAGRRDRRLRQLSARAHADRARSGRRAAAGRLSRSCSGPASACSARRSEQKPMRLLDTRTIGDGLAFLTYELVREV